jgi:hypothetical protein
MRPVRSAIGMKMSGPTFFRSGRFHRTSTSTPVHEPSGRRTIGW